MPYREQLNVDVMLGEVLKNVIRINAHETESSYGDEEIIFELVSGKKYKLFHRQDCCESVTIKDISGDLNDLVGLPLKMSEEVASFDENAKISESRGGDSHTWTFYKFATEKGYVTMSWYGTSNGYYSEGVNFTEAD
jgi:hypothetical protein